MDNTILITGGLGYIGSHIATELIANNFNVHIVDNLSNSDVSQLQGIQTITGNTPNLTFEQADIRDQAAMRRALKTKNISAVIHCAGHKSVANSISSPLDYYNNNVNGSISLLSTMEEVGVTTVLFSSSATVYGQPATPAIKETAPTTPVNPYGNTKLTIENLLLDLKKSNSKWRTISLRYFNPAGAHESGLIGDRFDKQPNNLFPIICQVLTGMRDQLAIYGDDYQTQDGTGERDYIHVTDLARAHVSALIKLISPEYITCQSTLNIGTGTSTSVLNVVRAFEKTCGLQIPFIIQPRRPGDIDKYFADPSLARKALDWKSTKSLECMCSDTWRWAKSRQTSNNLHTTT